MVLNFSAGPNILFPTPPPIKDDWFALISFELPPTIVELEKLPPPPADSLKPSLIKLLLPPPINDPVDFPQVILKSASILLPNPPTIILECDPVIWLKLPPKIADKFDPLTSSVWVPALSFPIPFWNPPAIKAYLLNFIALFSPPTITEEEA